MKVTMVVHRFPSPQGGAERQVESLAPFLVERGVDLSVVARYHPVQPPDFEHATVRQVPIRGGRVRRAAGFVTGGVAQIRELRPDVIHAHGLLSPSTAAVLAGGTLGVPVVAKVLLGGANGEIQRLQSWRRVGPPRLRALRARVDRFVVISAEIDAELERCGVDLGQRAFIPNGVDTTRFRRDDLETRATTRRELGIDDEPMVLFVGRLHPQKGLATLIAAWRRVRRTHPTARLVMVGEGIMRPELESSDADGVLLTGQVPDVAPFLAAADLLVLPSIAEGLSNALLEAMASGLAIVATPVGATGEVLNDAGRLVTPGDVDELSAALDDLLSDPDLRTRLGDAAREKVEDGFQLAVTADRLVALYRELLEER